MRYLYIGMTLPKYMSKDAKTAPSPTMTDEEFFAKIRSGEIVLRPLVNLEDESPIDSLERGAIDSFDM